jgi:uncharacterized membrane protein
MIHTSGSVEIRQPSDRVFAFVSTVENAPKWQSELTESRLLTEGPLRVGSKFKEVVKLLGRPIELICETTELEPGRKLAFKSDNDRTMQFDVTFLVEPQGGSASRVTITSNTRVGGLLRLLEPFFAGEVKSASKKELERLKAALENGR